MAYVFHVVIPHPLHLLILTLDLPLDPLYYMFFLSNLLLHTFDF